MIQRLRIRFSAWFARRRARLNAKVVRIEPPDAGIGAEAPIRTSSQDRLRRTDFAGRIASVLSELSPREGRVFAIRGGWGFGKSSLKNLISERLDAKNDGADWLNFNPWQWGEGDAIARALFGQIADRLGGGHSRVAIARAEALRRYGAILTRAGKPLKEAKNSISLISMALMNASVIAIASAIGFDLPTAAIVAVILAVFSVGMPLVGQVLSHLGRDRTGEPLNEVRTTLEVQLRELNRPVVIFVDDIDRLEPEQIRMLLRQVKANANLPNIVFVLLFQPSIVERALDPVADGNGRAFLEKIVQTNFDLPAVPVSIVHRLLGEELSEMAGSYATEVNGFSQLRWGNAFAGGIQPMVRNMRDARRLISSVAVHLPVHVTADVFEVNIVDFLLLETLRVFEPDLHEAIFNNRELVLQEGRFQGAGQENAQKEAAEQFLSVVSAQRRIVARDALKELFPTIEWGYGGPRYDHGFRSGWLKSKRVCTSRYFARYFELQTSTGEMSESRFVEFLIATATEEGLASAIAAVEADGLLHSLVSRFDESVDRLPAENAAVLLPGMFRVAQKLVGLEDVGSFSSPWISAWRATNWFLKRIPEDVRGGLALQALRQTGALSVAAILIHLSDPANRKERNEDRDLALDPKTVEAMKTEYLRMMRSRAADGDALITEPGLISLLYRWKDYTGSLDEPRHWMAAAIQTEEGFAKMATRMMSRGSSHTFGDRVSVPFTRFNKETVDDFIGIDVAMVRCSAIDPAAFPVHKEALRKLHSSLEMWLGLREYDPFEV